MFRGRRSTETPRDLRRWRAQALNKQDDWRLSLRASNAALTLDPENVKGLYRRAVALFGLGKCFYGSAEGDLRRVLEKAPENRDARRRLAQVLEARAGPKAPLKQKPAIPKLPIEDAILAERAVMEADYDAANTAIRSARAAAARGVRVSRGAFSRRRVARPLVAADVACASRVGGSFPLVARADGFSRAGEALGLPDGPPPAPALCCNQPLISPDSKSSKGSLRCSGARALAKEMHLDVWLPRRRPRRRPRRPRARRPGNAPPRSRPRGRRSTRSGGRADIYGAASCRRTADAAQITENGLLEFGRARRYSVLGMDGEGGTFDYDAAFAEARAAREKARREGGEGTQETKDEGAAPEPEGAATAERQAEGSAAAEGGTEAVLAREYRDARERIKKRAPRKGP